MKRRYRTLFFVLVLHLFGLNTLLAEPVNIAFGSCVRQWKPQPVWDGILSVNPQVFVFMGDNVYTDTGPYRFKSEPERIKVAYNELASVEGFRRLLRKIPVYATWDDHDYGRNDAGADYPHKEASEAHFLDFFDVPADAPEHGRPGIYSTRYLDSSAGPIQIILLDTRFFRSPLHYGHTDSTCPRVKLIPSPDPAATMLGDAQWRWLETQLEQPAALRLLVSSIQVIPDQHCYEKWANFPQERRRLLDLIGKSKGGKRVLLSGDRHLAEISRIDESEFGAPIYEITSSGMNSAGAGKAEKNRYRVTPDNVREDNFGLIQFDPAVPNQAVRLQIRGVDGAVLQEVIVPKASTAGVGP